MLFKNKSLKQAAALAKGVPFSPPDFECGSISAKEFRQILTEQGAVMLRGAVNVQLLKNIETELLRLFEKYASIPPGELEKYLNSTDPIEKDFWQQIKLGHIYDHTFKPFAGFSYYDIVKTSGLWDLARKAWRFHKLAESAICGCRRMYPSSNGKLLWDTPIHYHVDAQYHYDELINLNFWTPLVPCGIDAPGLKVILLGIEETKKYLEYNPKGYDPEPTDFARMHKFRHKKMQIPALQEYGLLEHVWAPKFNLGDVLVLNNYTMHASHVTADMTLPRMSIEVRVDLR